MQATGVVYEKNGVMVTAFEVDHGALIKPAYGHRIDYEGRSVILSGDTRYSENLEKHAQGATLVVHEVAIANQERHPSLNTSWPITSRRRRRVRCSQGSSRNLPPTRISSSWSPDYPAPKVADLERATRETYSGPLALGTDLMAFDVRDDQVIVIPDASKK